MSKRLSILVLLAISSNSAFSCPPGMVPNGPATAGMTNSGCRPASSYDGPRWEYRWGALAVGENGIGGWATGKRSLGSAKRAAVAHCQNRGGTACESDYTYKNKCIAVVNGPKEASIQTASSEEEAKELAMLACMEDESGRCRLFHSGCSLPVRVQ